MRRRIVRAVEAPWRRPNVSTWALPHFYFHVVTAYDILRHSGVVIGKHDYLSQVGSFIEPRDQR